MARFCWHAEIYARRCLCHGCRCSSSSLPATATAPYTAPTATHCLPHISINPSKIPNSFGTFAFNRLSAGSDTRQNSKLCPVADCPFPCSPLPLSSLSLPFSVCLLYLALIFMIAHPSVRVESSVLLSIRIRIGIFIALILLPVLFALSLSHFLPLSLSTTPSLSLSQCVLRVVFYLAWRIKIHKTHFHAQQLPNAERNLYLNAHTHAHSHTTNTPSRQLKFFPFHFPISLVSPSLSLSFSLALLFSFIERICYSLLLYFYANVRVYCVLLSLCVCVCVCLCVVYVLIVLLNTAQ